MAHSVCSALLDASRIFFLKLDSYIIPAAAHKKQRRGLTPLFCFFVRVGKVEAKTTGGVKECEANQDLNTPFTHLSSSLFTA